MEQYFTKNPTSEKEIYKFSWNIKERTFHFYTSNSVFSKNGVDFGSMLLLETVIDENEGFEGSVLDLGCGYGPIGVAIAKILDKSIVFLSDVNERALELSSMNVQENKLKDKITIINSEGFENIDKNFDIVITNPPIRAGKNVVFSFYEGAYEHLNKEGMLYVVIQKKQGAESSIKKIKDLFGNCKIANKKSGYFILKATK